VPWAVEWLWGGREVTVQDTCVWACAQAAGSELPCSETCEYLHMESDIVGTCRVHVHVGNRDGTVRACTGGSFLVPVLAVHMKGREGTICLCVLLSPEIARDKPVVLSWCSTLALCSVVLPLLFLEFGRCSPQWKGIGICS